jgi:phage terminase large subunit-like protein
VSRYPTLTRDHLADIEQYANDVLTGARVAGRYERLAVERESADLARIGDSDWPYFFDPDAALKAIRFVETFPHVKGEWARHGHAGLLDLSGWQKWCLAQIFGWKVVDTGLRRFTSAAIYVARKNGKTTLVSPVGLFMLTHDGEVGAEVYCGATNQKQADEVFQPAKKMAERNPFFRKRFGVDVQAQRIEKISDGGKFERLIGNPGDGGSPSCYIGDEYHEHLTDAQRETMVTGMGARRQPLEIMISTAGSNWYGPCGQHWNECQEVLDGVRSDESQFAIIYAADKGDEWDSDEALEKANPNLGISVKRDFLLRERDKAKQSPRKQSAFKTKHLNIWVGARDAWLNMDHWNAMADPSLSVERFVGQEGTKGIDLSEVDDLTADVSCFACELSGEMHYYFFARTFVTAAKVQEVAIYQEWVESGHLQVCDGNAIDYEDVEEGIRLDSERHIFKGLFYDPYGAAVLAQGIHQDTAVPIIKVAQSYGNFTEPMRGFESLLRQGRIHHNGDPVLAWCLGNVVAKTTMDGKQTRPVKDNAANKIDTAVAMLLAFIGAWAPDEQPQRSVYEDRGVLELEL